MVTRQHLEVRDPARPRTLQQAPVVQQLTARGVLVLAIVVSSGLGLLDLWLSGRVHTAFDIGFLLVCVAGAFVIKPRDFYTAAVMPPLVLAVAVALLALLRPSALAPHASTFSQGLLGGLARHAAWLVTAYVLTLLIIAGRARRR